MEGRWPRAIRIYIITLRDSLSYTASGPHHPCKNNVACIVYVCIMYEKEINWKEWHIPTKRLNIIDSWWIIVRNLSQVNCSTIYSLDLQPFCFQCKRVSTAAVAIFASNNRGGGSHLGYLVIYQKVQPANLCKDAASCTLIWRYHHSPAAELLGLKGQYSVYGYKNYGTKKFIIKEGFLEYEKILQLFSHFEPPSKSSFSYSVWQFYDLTYF
jgi:hypothetical protein